MESESGQSDVTTIDPTKRIVKYFSKCLIELLKHAESIQFKNNKLVNYDVTTTHAYDSCNEIDITEHQIKSEIQRDGPIFKVIDRIKQSLVELLTICSHQNIIIDYDTSKQHVAVYDAFDDSQRILVMNHLTLNILSLVENIYLALKYFKSLKYAENGPAIRKTFSNVYKELKALPMRSDIIENMDSSFKSLTPKSEYTDSYNYLVEKLSVLFKYVCKFNKSYSKKCGYTDLPTTEYSTDDDHTPRKKRNIIIKPEDNIYTTKRDEFPFKVPTIENAKSLQNIQKQSDDTKKKKKHKLDTNQENEKKNSETEIDAESLLNSILNEKDGNTNSGDTKKKKKHKLDTNQENEKKNSETEIDAESLLNSILNEKDGNTNSGDTKKKKKHKLDTNQENENKNGETEIDAESLLNSILNEKDGNTNSGDTKKKKKHKLDTNQENENKNGETEIDAESVLSSLFNDTIDECNNSEIKKKSKKSKKTTETNENTNKETIDTNEKTSETKEKVNEETNGEANKKENKKQAKKEKLNKNNKEGNNKKRKQSETNTPNEKTKKRPKLNLESTEDDLNNLAEEAIDENNDSLSVDLLSAISKGDIEIDYDKKDVEDFTKIINENELNNYERFLYIQDLLDKANAKVALSEEIKDKMRNLNILIDWEVPPAHLLATSLSAGPTDEERALLAQIPVTSGPFNSKEDECMQNNWKDFIEKHDLEDDPAPFMLCRVDNKQLLSYEERRKFLQYLGRGLPHKSLHSIWRRFKVLFKRKVKRGRFSPEEDELILTYLNNIKREDTRQKFNRLAPLIKRDRLQIERRYKILREAANGEPKKLIWTLELKEKYLKHLLEETQSASVYDLRDMNIDTEVFNILGKIMNISWRKLRLHWIFRMHTELFSLEPINTDNIKIKLIKKFKELKCDDWKTIDWPQITAMYRGITKCYLWLLLKNAINEGVPPEIQKDLKSSIDYLHENSLPLLEQRYAEGKSRILPRLRYEDDTLSYYK